jgi:hypothetical protein
MGKAKDRAVRPRAVVKKFVRKSAKGKKKTGVNSRRQGVFYSPQKVANTTGLRGLKVQPFPKLLKWSEAKCKALLMRKKVTFSKLLGRTCWKCNGPLQLSRDKSHLRCNAKKCHIRLTRPRLAYTPFWRGCCGKKKVTCKDLVRTAYCVGLRCPQDVTHHKTSCGQKKTDHLVQDCRVALAYAEVQKGAEVTFSDGEVDFDTVATIADRSSKRKTVHLGRFMAFKERKSKKFCLIPLAGRTVKKGQNLPPERYDEVSQHMKKKLLEGSIAMSDSSPSFKKSIKEINKIKCVPSATVVHSKYEYVRPAKILLSSLPKKMRKKLVKQRPGQVSRVYYPTLAGDQAAEGLFGTVNNQMRRCNLTGRRNTKRAHINFLSSARLWIKPGLDSVLEAMSIYRRGIQDKIDPKKAYGKNVDTKWLNN